tara:strand:- start:281 stop:1285 length:1005 start_codon:yes stop_codon:yes gene_type:complete
MKIKLEKKYVIGVHVMFFEIEIYKEYIEGLINLLETVDNKENVYLDFCFNCAEHIETIDTSKITKEKLISQFQEGINKLQHKLAIPNIKYWIHNTSDGFYFHADYRRDLNYNYCKKVDYVMWGETDSFFPKEAFQAIETLSAYTDEQNIHKYILSFADRKMWDSSWDPLVHPKFEKLTFVDDDKSHLNPNQAKSPLSIKKMNEINSESKEFDFIYLKKPKISGSCLVISSDLIKFGVNIPLCLLYNDDHGLSIMAEKLCKENYLQFICKNIIHVHARRHPNKRLYVKDESNPNSFGNLKHDNFQKFLKLSKENVQTLISNGPNKFYEYKDFNKL